MSNPPLYRYFIHIAFDGTNYHGWQVQPNDSTVQKIIEHAISLILRHEVKTYGCGRTDSGVHAIDFYAHFDHNDLLDPNQLDQLTYKLNAFLPKNIVVFGIFRVQSDVHARFSALNRTYKYYISRKKDPFRVPYTWYYPVQLDLKLMQKGAGIIPAYKDFAAFSKKDTDIVGTICNIEYASWEEDGDEYIFTIKANRFLRNMVRAITGTLLDMGRGKLNEEGLRQVIESNDRCKAGESVPACGLFLFKVEYPEGYRI